MYYLVSHKSLHMVVPRDPNVKAVCPTGFGYAYPCHSERSVAKSNFPVRDPACGDFAMQNFDFVSPCHSERSVA